METEKKDIEKNKKESKLCYLTILGMLCIAFGSSCFVETGCGALLFFGLIMTFMPIFVVLFVKTKQEISKKEQSSQKTCKVENKIEMKAILKSIRNKIFKVLKSIYSFLRMIFCSPITTNIFLLVIVCMLSGIKYSVVHHSDYSLSSSEVTSAIKDALDDYGFIQVRRY